MTKTPKQIVEAVRNAGIIGAGGGGFPTYVKLDAKVDTIIANGSECEPLLESDKTLMKERASLIIEGMQLAMTATGAKRELLPSRVTTAMSSHPYQAFSRMTVRLQSTNSKTTIPRATNFSSSMMSPNALFLRGASPFTSALLSATFFHWHRLPMPFMANR